MNQTKVLHSLNNILELEYVLTDSDGYYSFTDIFNGWYKFQAITGGTISAPFKIVNISNANEEEVNFNSN